MSLKIEQKLDDNTFTVTKQGISTTCANFSIKGTN